MDDHTRTNREAEHDLATEERKNSFRPFSANPMATASPKKDPTGMIRMGSRPAVHLSRKVVVVASLAPPAKEKDTSWIEPVLDSVRYPVDAGAALSYHGQGKGQKRFPHGGGLERFTTFLPEQIRWPIGWPWTRRGPVVCRQSQAYVFRLPPQNYFRKWDGRSHERHRHHDPGGALTYCVYKHLGDGQKEDATDAQTGGSQGHGQPNFPLAPLGQGD